MHLKTSTQNFIRCVCFLIIFFIGLQFISDKMVRQTVSGVWNYTVKVGGFYKQEPQSIEVIGLGSSHMYCTMVPNEIWNASGINSYVLSTQEQTLEMTYHYLIEALKTQRPKVVLVETHMFNYDSTFNDGAASNAIETLPWSMNKADLILDVIPQNLQMEFFFPILKYHSVWTTIGMDYFENRYQGQSDPFRGYVYLNETRRIPELTEYETSLDIEIDTKSLKALQDIIDLTQEENIPLVLFHAPTEMNDASASDQEYLRQYANAQNIPYLDMNDHLEEMGIVLTEDFYDTGHLNINGAQKATQYLVDYLEETIEFGKVYSSSTKKELEEASKKYLEKLSE